MPPLIPIENDPNGLKYQCQHDWPATAVLHFHWRHPLGLECFKMDDKDEPYLDHTPRCSCHVHMPLPDGIPSSDHWQNGALQRSHFSVLAGDETSWQATENMAWQKLQEMLHCNHQWHDTTWNLSGDGSCAHCHMFVHGMFMDHSLRATRLLAFQAHEGTTRKFGGGPYIMHPQAVFERINWWRRDLPRFQWLKMGKAAWAHDIIEDCSHISHAQIIVAGGDDTHRLVLELTNPSKYQPDLPRRERKKMDRDHLKTVSWEAKVIKFFDRLDNIKVSDGCTDKRWMALYAAESTLLYTEVFEPFLSDMARTFPYAEHMKKEYLSWLRALERRSM